MNKYILVSLMLMGVSGYHSSVIAGSFSENQTGGTLTSTITMTVGVPTCTLDAAVENVDFQDITVEELRSESRVLPTNVILTCDTIPSGITLTITPVGSSTVDSTRTGVITSSLTGTGYYLRWADGSAYGVKDEAVDYNTPYSLTPALTNEIKLNVTPVSTTSGSISSGSSQATVNLVMNYI